MISKLTYVNCDECGAPAEAILGSAAEARMTARLVDRFVRIEGQRPMPGVLGEEET